MDEYVKVKKLLNEIIVQLKIRLYKKLYLPFELIGMNEGEKTEYYLNELDTSEIRWKFEMNDVPKPSKKIIAV